MDDDLLDAARDAARESGAPWSKVGSDAGAKVKLLRLVDDLHLENLELTRRLKSVRDESAVICCFFARSSMLKSLSLMKPISS